MNFIKHFLLYLVIYDLGVIANNNKKNWWKYTTIYEVYVWSFKDSNGDGIGDINGVTSMLDHFVDLGIETIWLSPYFKSPMRDMGYDISNFLDIDPKFGTLKDFDELIRQMKKRDLKLVMDLVINHSSDEHPFFQKSVDRIDPYTDYYVWVNCSGYDKDGLPIPPNNWVSLFGGTAWTWNEKREQFYFHKFSERQPDFNLRNPFLKAEIKEIMKFWFDRGIAGSRLDAAQHYIEDPLLRDDPICETRKNVPVSELLYYDYKHIYTADLWETYEFIHELREFVDNNCSTRNNENILIAEAYTDLNHTLMYYGNKSFPIVHFPFNFDFVMLKTFPSPKKYDAIIRNWLDNMPSGGIANWVAENHDNFRIGNRLNEEYMDIILVTIMTLPGIACIYYGQEIGMVNINIRPDQIRDPNNDVRNKLTRDPERLPMQWDNSMNAGFTSNVKPWLPVNTNYWRVNVELQKHQTGSRYNLYKTLSKLRTTNTLKFGGFQSYLVAPWIYAFSRFYKRQPTYISVFNMGTETEIVHLHHSIPKIPPYMKVVATSINAGYKVGDIITTNPKFPSTFIMRPLSVIIITTN